MVSAVSESSLASSSVSAPAAVNRRRSSTPSHVQQAQQSAPRRLSTSVHDSDSDHAKYSSHGVQGSQQKSAPRRLSISTHDSDHAKYLSTPVTSLGVQGSSRRLSTSSQGSQSSQRSATRRLSFQLMPVIPAIHAPRPVEHASTIDKLARVLFPCSFLAFNLAYWLIYTTT